MPRIGGLPENPLPLFDLGAVEWWESQCIYHALAALGREGVVLCWPKQPYVCLGIHDDLEQEVDQDYCRRHSLPLMRRETGGGVVYLDQRQVFYQLVLHRDDPLLPASRPRLFERFLRPAIAVYRELGVPAALRPPADLEADGRKCSGNAAGDIGTGVVYVGNIMLDFDYSVMSRILRVPDRAFRSRFEQAMRDHMTTLAEWRLEDVRRSTIAALLTREFAREFGPLQPSAVEADLRHAMAAARVRLTERGWLTMPGRRSPYRRIKVAEGVYLEDDAAEGVPELRLEPRAPAVPVVAS